MMNNNEEQKISCPKPDCKAADDFQYIGEDRGKMIVVNSIGNVKYNSSRYLYKCLNCHTTFYSSTPPTGLYKKILHG